MRRTLKRLKSKYIAVSEDKEGNMTVRITKQGMSQALSQTRIHGAKSQRMGRKWRIVADIPEK
jgi:hypothetical protein